MATGGGIQFLQANVEDESKVLGAYKAGNTEVIRKMLREQQRECQVLHANPLFKEFRNHPGSIQARKFGKGYVVDESGGMPQQLTDPKGLEYEGQARMFDLIKNTAVKEEKACRGVWASFGAPYVPLGDPKELQKTLPELNRDKMGSREGERTSMARRKAKPTAQQQHAAQQQQQGEGGQAAGGPGARGRRRGGGKGGAGDGGHGSEEDPEIGVPVMYGDGDEGGEHGVSSAEAAIRAATREAEDTLNKHKSVMRFNIQDRTEATFPGAVLRNADARSRKAKAAAGAFVNRREAEEEIADPLRAYGQPVLPRRTLAPIGGAAGRGTGGGEDADPSSFFLTQQGGAQAAQDEERRHMSLDPGMLSGPTPRHDTSAGSAGGTLFGGTRGGGEGQFSPLVEAVVPLRGDEANPVYKWHNDFVAIRQAGRAQLQQHLYSRAQGRVNARTDPSAAAAMSTTLFGVLNLTQGRLPTYAAGGKMVSPYARLDAYQQAQEAARRNTKQKAVQALEPAEIRILQRFYDQLCALVEAQRMSDPLCLMVVSKVKQLLEAGVYLHRPMLVAVVEHVADFARGAGMMRYNKYLLAVLTFIAKCVGMEVADLEDVVEQHGVCMVLYGTTVPPSKCTAEHVAALADDDGNELPPAPGLGGSGAAAAAAAGKGGAAAKRPNGLERTASMRTRSNGKLPAMQGSGGAGAPPAVAAALHAAAEAAAGAGEEGQGGAGRDEASKGLTATDRLDALAAAMG